MKKITGILFSIFLVFLLAGCTSQQTAQPESGTPSSAGAGTVPVLAKGVTLSPKSFQADDFTGFFEKAKQAGTFVSWAGDWSELSNTQSGAPAVLSALADNYKLVPVVEAQFFEQSNGQLLKQLDDTTKQSYKDNAVAFAETFKPKYMGFGIEVNVLYEKSPVGFDEFVKFYNEVYDAVKAKSPSTKVFTVFQLEKVKGLNGGLFGGENNPSNAQWFLLEKFPKSDLVAFTTYPSLVYKNPSEIPLNYYSEIRLHTARPVAFTEIGWHSASNPVGWESSEAKQAEFVKKFFSLTKNLKQEFSIWSFLYDQETIEPFNSMGLFNKEGTAKKAWQQWLDSK